MSGYIGIEIVVAGGLTSLKFSDGQVSSDGFPDLSLALKPYIQLLDGSTQNFVSAVTRLNPSFALVGPLDDSNPPVNFVAKRQGNNLIFDSRIAGEDRLDSLHTFDMGTGIITAHRPNAFEIDWNMYLLWMQQLKAFSMMCRMAIALEPTSIIAKILQPVL